MTILRYTMSDFNPTAVLNSIKSMIPYGRQKDRHSAKSDGGTDDDD